MPATTGAVADDDSQEFRRLLPEVSDETVDWLARTLEVLRTELGFKGIPVDITRDVLPILAGLGFEWPRRAEMKIIPRLKRR